MKQIQIIDGADNCTFSIYRIPDRIFEQLFPEKGQDIEFIEDAEKRLGKRKIAAIIKHTWVAPEVKSKVMGIHGTLFIGLTGRKVYFETKRNSDVEYAFTGQKRAEEMRGLQILRLQGPFRPDAVAIALLLSSPVRRVKAVASNRSPRR